MKRILKKIVSVALVAMMLFIVPCSEANAVEEIQTINENVVKLDAFIIDTDDVKQNNDISFFTTTFTEASIFVSFSAKGMLAEFYVSTNREASIIGVKDIKIQKKVWYGWSTIGDSLGKESSNCSSMACGVRYAGAELGETYRVSCTFYGDVDGYHELSGTTDGFVCEY